MTNAVENRNRVMWNKINSRTREKREEGIFTQMAGKAKSELLTLERWLEAWERDKPWEELGKLHSWQREMHGKAWRWETMVHILGTNCPGGCHAAGKEKSGKNWSQRSWPVIEAWRPWRKVGIVLCMQQETTGKSLQCVCVCVCVHKHTCTLSVCECV